MSTKDGRVRNSEMAHRYRFLWAVQKLVPEVLAALDHDVFPLFRAMFRDEQQREPSERGVAIWSETGVSTAMLWITWPSSKTADERREKWMGPSWAADIRGAQLDSDGLRFRDAMEKWAATHNLCSERILEDAFSTLNFWLANPHGRRVWLPSGASWTADELANVPKLRIEDSWNFEPWPVVHERLQEQIAAYRSQIKLYSAKIGFDLDRMRDDRSHHQWLALFQCRGMSPQKIRDWHKQNNGTTVDPTAVSHAIEKLAKRIGLERRTGKRGHRRVI